jgi:glycerol-3-phosphate dehydrogenase
MPEQSSLYDICVIGGGINGAGIARDAAGRGLATLLLEKDDLASATSSKSTKLIHGGLRYLEYFEFRLVHEALRERDVLLSIAPHIIWPLKFVLPDAHAIRPYWMIRCGLLLYDLFSFSFRPGHFPRSRGVDFRQGRFAGILKGGNERGVSYSDGWVQDTRLTVLNAVDAAARGADIRTRCGVEKIVAEGGAWTISFRNRMTGESGTARARILVNAAGPWTRALLDENGLATTTTPQIRLVRGSHIVVPRLHETDHAYMFQQPDRRIIFAIPYETRYTLIGTTDEDYDGDPAEVAITEGEIDYLIESANRYFQRSVSRFDIVHSFSGVRPLLKDENESAREVTRDYKIHEEGFEGARLITVFGGKITTYRRLAENVLTRVMKGIGKPDRRWTKRLPLPGGDIPDADYAVFLNAQLRRYAGEDPDIVRRYARNYGTVMHDILAMPRGRDFGDGIHEREIRYLVKHEFALSVDDILWRRSKMGLHAAAETLRGLEAALPDIVREIKGYDIEKSAGY